MRSLFSSPKLKFAPIDPLEDGLGDDIADEENEAGFMEDMNGEALVAFWSDVARNDS